MTVVAALAPERKGGTSETAVSDHGRPHEPLGGASAPPTERRSEADAHEREEAGHHGDPGHRDRLAAVGDLEVDAGGPGERGGEGGGHHRRDRGDQAGDDEPCVCRSGPMLPARPGFVAWT